MRAFGVTMSRSGPIAPCAMSRALSCSIATAETSWRMKCSATVMSMVIGRGPDSDSSAASRSPRVWSETIASVAAGSFSRSTPRTRL
jgi:hypothetical protein